MEIQYQVNVDGKNSLVRNPATGIDEFPSISVLNSVSLFLLFSWHKPSKLWILWSLILKVTLKKDRIVPRTFSSVSPMASQWRCTLPRTATCYMLPLKLISSSIFFLRQNVGELWRKSQVYFFTAREKKTFGEISQDTIDQIDLEKKDQWSL